MKRKFIAIGALTAILIFSTMVWMAGSILSASANQPVGSPPAEFAIKLVQFPSASGTTIRGWLIQGNKGSGVIVLMHGVRANRLSMLGRARFLSQAGYSVLLFDFQGHGESTGQHITFGYLESKDAQAAVKAMSNRFTAQMVKANMPIHYN